MSKLTSTAIDPVKHVPLYRFDHGPDWLRFTLDGMRSTDQAIAMRNFMDRFPAMFGADLQPLFILFDPRKETALQRARTRPNPRNITLDHPAWNIIALFTVHPRSGAHFFEGFSPPPSLTVPFLRWLLPPRTPLRHNANQSWPPPGLTIDSWWAVDGPQQLPVHPGRPLYDLDAYRLLNMLAPPVQRDQAQFLAWVEAQKDLP